MEPEAAARRRIPARAPARRAWRRAVPVLLAAGGCYLLMAAEGAAAPPAIVTTGTPLAYTENEPATALDPALTITDLDGDDVITNAAVGITGGFVAGQDVLAFTNQLGITGIWNAGSGVLTLTGTATVADYQTALRSVTYRNTSDDPDPTTRTVTFVITDGELETNSATRDVTVGAVDDPLSVTTTSGSLAYTEGAGSLAVDTGLTVVDLDDDVTGATVQITGDYVNGEDVLSFADQLGITGSWNAATGTLTLTGTASAADYQTALRTVAYANTSENPSPLPRTVTFTVTTTTNAAAVRVVAITAVNDPPAAGGDTTVTDPGGGPANVLEDAVPSAPNVRLAPPTLTDVDGAAPTQVRILSVTGGTLAQADGSTIGLGAGGSLLTLAGGAVDLRFTPAADRDVDATFAYVVVDAGNPGLNSAASTATVPIVPVNDAPAVTATAGAVAYTENDGPVPVDTGLTVGDVDDADLEGATVQVTGAYTSGEDVLSFTDQLGITGSWNAGTGVLTLSGTATLADYQAALRTVTYENTSDAPSASPRTISFTVDDGALASGAATRGVTVTPANDAPTVATSGGAASYTENDAAVVLDAAVDLDDVDSATLAGATVQITGNHSAGEDVLAFVDQAGIIGSWNSASGTLTLAGAASVADYETALRSVTYVSTSDDPSTASRTVSISVSDGTATSAAATRTVTVAAVNDPPVLVATGTPATYTENAAAIAVDDALDVGDLDDATIEGATVTITGYWNGEDQLAFTDQLGITGSWNSTTGTLTLTGTAPVADYETALRSVTYVDTSDAPNTAARTVTFVVDDGTDPSNAAGRTVTVVAVNDLPVVTLTGGGLTYTEDDPPVGLDTAAAVTDPDDASLTGGRVRIASGYVPGQDVLAATDGGGVTSTWDPDTGTLELTGAAGPATYETILRGVTFRNTSQEPAAGNRVLSVVLDDPGGSSAAATRTVTVVSVNDAPVANDDAATTRQATAVEVDVLGDDTDAENDPLTISGTSAPSGTTVTVTPQQRLRVVPARSFTGTLTVGYTVSDGDATDGGTLLVTVTPVADLSATIRGWPPLVYTGEDVTFEVVVTNGGPGTADDPVVDVDTGGLPPVAATTAGGTCTPIAAGARCRPPDITGGNRAVVSVSVRPPFAGVLTARATARSGTYDPDADDRVPTVEVAVFPAPVPSLPAPPAPRPAPARPGPRRGPSAPVTTSTSTTVPATTSASSTTTSTSTTSTSSAPSTTTTTTPGAVPTSAATVTDAAAERDPSGPVGALALVAVVAAALVAGALAMRRVQR